MSTSHESTEWHLTPNGWIPGHVELDCHRTTRDKPSTPQDSLLIVRYVERVDTFLSGIEQYHIELYKDPDSQAVDFLLNKYGDCPKIIAAQYPT